MIIGMPLTFAIFPGWEIYFSENVEYNRQFEYLSECEIINENAFPINPFYIFLSNFLSIYFL